MDKLVLRSGYELNEEHRPPPIFDFETNVDFDDLSPEQLGALSEKAYELTRKISEHQLDTQSNCVTFSGIDRKNGFAKITKNQDIRAEDARSQQYHINEEKVRHVGIIGIAEINGYHKMSPIISELAGKLYTRHELTMRGMKHHDKVPLNEHIATRFHFDSDVINLTITHCKNIRIDIEGDIKVGIECISSHNISINCESFYFTRIHSCNNIVVNGDAKRSSILDMRYSLDIMVGGQVIMGNAFTSIRYTLSKDGAYVRVSDNDDVFQFDGAKSLPDVTLAKYHNTSRKYRD